LLAGRTYTEPVSRQTSRSRRSSCTPVGHVVIQGVSFPNTVAHKVGPKTGLCCTNRALPERGEESAGTTPLRRWRTFCAPRCLFAAHFVRDGSWVGHELRIFMGPSNECIILGGRVRALDPRPRGEVSIPVEALTRHVCILGTTGSGKSTTAAIICLELARLKIPALVLDRTGEYAELLSSIKPWVLRPGENLRVSLFDPKGVYTHQHTDEWISLLDHFSHVNYGVGLSALQERVLREAFETYFHGTRRPLAVLELVARVQRMEAESSELSGWAEGSMSGSCSSHGSPLWTCPHSLTTERRTCSARLS